MGDDGSEGLSLREHEHHAYGGKPLPALSRHGGAMAEAATTRTERAGQRCPAQTRASPQAKATAQGVQAPPYSTNVSGTPAWVQKRTRQGSGAPRLPHRVRTAAGRSAPGTPATNCDSGPMAGPIT